MTRQEMISKARETFLKASQEFNFEFITPAELGDGISAFGYIAEYDRTYFRHLLHDWTMF